MAKFQLSIPEPCAEKWEQMKPTSCGAFCNSCQKDVVDFTAMPDQEIRHFFRNTRKNVCGRFHKKQLQHTYQDKQALSKAWAGYMFAAFVGLGLPGFVNAQHIPSVKPDTAQREPELYPATQKSSKPSEVDSPPSKLALTVVDRISGQPIPGVVVRVLKNNIGAVTDIEGRVFFDEDLFDKWRADSIRFSFIGYKDKLLPIHQLQTTHIIVLEEDVEALAGEVIVGGAFSHRWWSPRSLWWKVKSLFQ